MDKNKIIKEFQSGIPLEIITINHNKEIFEITKLLREKGLLRELQACELDYIFSNMC